MKQLIYVSEATLQPSEEVDFVAQQIIIQSMQLNRLVDITGFLVTSSGRFLQLLEGPQASVDRTFTRIARDPRHRNIVVISQATATSRLFHNWSMAIARTEEPLPALLDCGRAIRLLQTAAQQLPD